MTMVPPVIPPLDLTGYPSAYRDYPTVQPFSQRSALTYQQKLEAIAAWIPQVLVPYLGSTLGTLDNTWMDDVNTLSATVQTALDTQAATVNTALSTQQATVTEELANTLAQITSGESAALNDAAVSNALQVANSQALAFLDGRYSKSGDALILNALAGFKADGSADMTSIINTALAALPVGQTNAVILPSAFGKTIVRIDGTLIVDIAKSGLSCPRGGVEFDATHSNGVPSVQVRCTAAVANNISASGPIIGGFKLTGPGSANVNSVGIYYHEPASANTGGQLRQFRIVDVSIALFETGIKFGDNVYNIVHDNCVIKGFNKYGVWVPATVTNSGERLVFTNSVIQEGYGATSVGIQNDATASIFYYHGSIDYVNGYFVNNTASGRMEFHSTHFERFITTSTNPWFLMAGGALKFYGGLITAAGTYASATAPVNLFSNTASPTYGDGVLLIDGTTFGNSLQVSSGYLATGTGNVIAVNTNRQNQFQTAFIHTSAASNMHSGQTANYFQDKWFLDGDTGTRTATQRTANAITGNNGNVTIQNTLKRSNPYAVQITKTGGALSVFEAGLAVPMSRLQTAGVSLWLARSGAVNGSFTLQFRYATIIEDPISARVGQTLNFYSLTITPSTDWPTVNTFYGYMLNNYVQRAPAWATHVVVYFECYNLGANSTIVVADPVITQY